MFFQRFNPHPAIRPGATRHNIARSACSAASFNPHPAIRPGATGKGGCGDTHLDRVSILTRPSGRVLLQQVICLARESPMFQSSPGHQAGCYHREDARVGDTEIVSILTRPSGRVLQPDRGGGGRHQGRFQSSPGHQAGCYNHPNSDTVVTGLFQSSPGHQAGCYLREEAAGHRTRAFQSSPGHQAGCYLFLAADGNDYNAVSILTRPSGRVLPISGVMSSHLVSMFQSSPGHQAGCYGPAGLQQNPHSYCFNPHPAIRPGATPPQETPPLVWLPGPCFGNLLVAGLP